MTIEMSEPLSVPFAEVGETLGANFSPSVVGINGRAYLLDTESGEYRQEGINVLQQRNTTNNRDLLLLPQDVWRQMFESWHQGAGQSNLDRDDALPFRFEASYGVNPWDKYHLSLLHETHKMLDIPNRSQAPVFLVVHQNRLAAISDDMISWFDTIEQDAASEETMVGISAVTGCTYDGDGIYTLHDGNMVTFTRDAHDTGEYAISGWPADFDTTIRWDFIAYTKDYLILGVGPQLWNITDPTKPVLVYTSPVVGFTWKGAAEGTNAIYLIGGAGDKHVVHRVQVAQDGTKLDPAVVAASLPDGEIGHSIGSYLGFVFIGTQHGVRMATPANQSGDLILGAVIPTKAPVLCFEGQDRFVWYGNSEINARFGRGQEGFPDRPVTGLGRMDLTTFTVTEGTPAYANDLVAEQGPFLNSVTAVTTWQDRRVFAVQGKGVFGESDRLMQRGWATHGAVSFGVEDKKTGLYGQFKWLPLSGSLSMWAAYDSQRYTKIADKNIPQSISSGNVPMNGQQFSRINIGFILTRDEGRKDQGPVLTRWEIRAVPVKGVASRWYLPILNHSLIELNGAPSNRDVLDELLILKRLVQRGGMVSLQESGITYEVTPRDFKWVPQMLSPTGHAWEGLFVLIVEEIS